MHILGTTLIFILTLKVCLGFYLQTSEVQAYIGENVILACNGSGFPVEELQVYWEAMGKDVISLQGDVVTVGRGFEDRVNFLNDPTASADFSLILSDLMLNDGDIYECLWEGTKPISSVLLQVSTPEYFTDNFEAFEGDDVTLDCFGNIPKNKPWEDIYIQWMKDDREIVRLSSGKMDVSIDYSILKLPAKHDISRGIFSLSIMSVSVFDQGVYQCRYKSTDYEAPRSGFPETCALTVWVMDTSATETGTDSAVFSEVLSSTASLSSSSVVSHTDASSSVPVWTSVAGAQTVPAHAYAGSSQTQSSSSLPTLTYAERAEALFVVTDPSVTETNSVTTDTLVTETDADSALFLVATDSSVTETDTDSALFLVATDSSVTETASDSALFLVATDSSVTETASDSALFLVAMDASVTETASDSVTKDRSTSVTETAADSALFLVATNTSVTETATDSVAEIETSSVTTDTSVTETDTDSTLFLLTTEHHSVTTDTSVTETDSDSTLFLVTTDASVTETATDSVMSDTAVPETGSVSGQRDRLEFLSDEIPWIRIGLISGVLLITAVVLGLLLKFQTFPGKQPIL